MDLNIVPPVLLLVKIVLILLSVLVVLVVTTIITLCARLLVLLVIMLIMLLTHAKIVSLHVRLAPAKLLVCLALWDFGMDRSVLLHVLQDNLLILLIISAQVVMLPA